MRQEAQYSKDEDEKMMVGMCVSVCILIGFVCLIICWFGFWWWLFFSFSLFRLAVIVSVVVVFIMCCCCCLIVGIYCVLLVP